MIARAHPGCEGVRKPGGNYAYLDHVIHISQRTCPHGGPPVAAEFSRAAHRHHPGSRRGNWQGRRFLVNLARVDAALSWLIAYSPVHRDIKLDHECLADLCADEQQQQSNDNDEMDAMIIFLHLNDTDNNDAEDRRR